MTDVTDGIRDYLASGGLFNPELMDHQRVRDLIIECRDEIERLREERAEVYAKYQLDRAELLTEIERLREDNTKIHGWFDTEAQRAGQLKRKLNIAEAKIKRLRELLRECSVFLEIGDDDCEVSYSMGILLKRVREALGDE